MVCPTVDAFSPVSGILHMRLKELTRRRKLAKTEQNTRGPARSASSMICASTELSGLSTVRDFCRI